MDMSIFALGVKLAAEIAAAFMTPSAEVVFAGDAMMHKPQITAAAQTDGSYDFDYCFSKIKPYIEDADYAVVNLEAPLGGRPYTGYPCFSAPDEYAQALSDAGFDLMLLANNHILDRRDKGLKKTVAVLDSLGISNIGAYPDSASRHNRINFIANIKGIKLGFLNYTYGTNGIEVQKDAVVNYIDRQQIADDISSIREAGAELLCVAVHWGTEYRLTPDSEQKSLAQFLEEQGVDIILGGHPHVVEPMEFRTNHYTNRPIALIYSLGNFISNQQQSNSRGGAMARIKIMRNTDGTATIDSLACKLIFTVPPGNHNPNYAIYEAHDSIPHMTSQRNEFISSTKKNFGKNNINIIDWTD